jgi:iron complex transport system ATP-binding protein
VELKLENLSLVRNGNAVLDRVSATIPSPGLTCLLGTNGAGKTTLVRVLSGELRATAGDYLIDGRNVCSLSRRDLSGYFSVIPQNAPVPQYLTVGEVVGLGRFRPRAALWWRLTGRDAEAVNRSLALCRMSAFRDRRMEELSGGEQRRAWLAFGLAPDKEFLILDETLDGLDAAAKRAFFRLLKEAASRERGILMASHDLDMITEYADWIVVLKAGTVIYQGRPDANLARFITELGSENEMGPTEQAAG